MENYNFIINPKNGKVYSIYSRKGKRLLKRCLKTLQYGGGVMPWSDKYDENPAPNDCCKRCKWPCNSPALSPTGCRWSKKSRMFLKNKAVHIDNEGCAGMKISKPHQLCYQYT